MPLTHDGIQQLATAMRDLDNALMNASQAAKDAMDCMDELSQALISGAAAAETAHDVLAAVDEEPQPAPAPVPTPGALWTGASYPASWNGLEGTYTADETRLKGWNITNGQYHGWVKSASTGTFRQYPLFDREIPLPCKVSWFFKIKYDTAPMTENDWLHVFTAGASPDPGWGDVMTITLLGRAPKGQLLLYHTQSQASGPTITSNIWYKMEVKLTPAGTGDWNVEAQLYTQLGAPLGSPMKALHTKVDRHVLRHMHFGAYGPGTVFPVEYWETGHQVTAL